MPRRLITGLLTLILFAHLLAVPGFAGASDWPMWRGDARRSAATDGQLPAELSLRWTRELPAPAPAWPREQDYHGKLEFDVADEPIVISGRVIVPSSARGSVTAFDADSGEELWRFYAEGPVRFAPAGWNDRVFFVSDDGHLYCLAASDGKLLWRFRGGPTDRHLLGNRRLISAWPARGAPVVADDVVYFGAGIWPFMGIFLHALDAESGDVIWTNSGSGAVYNLHQHGGALAFGGVAPQGYIAVADNDLIVSGGLTVPAIFDRQTGAFRHFQQSHAAVGKGAGGWSVAARGDLYFNHGKIYRLEDGKQLGSLDAAAFTDKHIIGLEKGNAAGFEFERKETEKTDRRGEKTIEVEHKAKRLWQVNLPDNVDQIFLQAGNRIYAGGNGDVVAVELPAQDAKNDASDDGRVAWTSQVDGSIRNMLAADGKLLVVTEEGRLYCFGESTGKDAENHTLKQPTDVAQADLHPTATRLLESTGATAGYAVVLGLNDGRLTESLVRQSDLYVIAVDRDAEKVARLRRQWDQAGIYGSRVALFVAEPLEFSLPPYLADLIVIEDVPSAGFDGSARALARLFHPLRPYGGAAVLALNDAERQVVQRELAAKLEGAAVSESDGWLTVARQGPLPGAGTWTHQYASAANTVFSTEKRVKLPLGVLWFGGPSNQYALPRHAQGPIPQVVGGRLFIEGVDTISARCVYTGRELWVREFPDIGYAYKASNHTFTGTVYIKNQPGANYVGSNYVSTDDGVYVVYQDECHRLDNTTGETRSTFRIPGEGIDPLAWGYIGISGDLLVAGAEPHIFDDKPIGEQNWNRTSSQRIVVMDRHSGDVLWSHDARHGFRHNAIVPAGDRLYAVDRLSDGAIDHLKRRGQALDDDPRLLAFDIRSGRVLWESTEDVFATWLGYSEEHDVLIQAGRTGGRASLPDEPSRRIIAHRGRDGEVLWTQGARYTGPLMIAGDWIIASSRGEGSFSILDGQPRTRRHPLTGATVDWSHTRTYGCGTMLGCENLLTFRSGAAGFFDLASDSGVGNFGGFRAGCTPNLIPADGVLNAPDYTRTCSCSYQNQTSLALVSMPDVEIWTASELPAPKKGQVILQAGINFGAAGDRASDDGILWLDYPSVGGPSPDVKLKVEPSETIHWFRIHSSLIEPSDEEAKPARPQASALATVLPWVAGSGADGVRRVEITLEEVSDPKPKRYTVHLHFLDPRAKTAGERIFDVALQGETRWKGIDVVRASGGPQRPIVLVAEGVVVGDILRIDLTPHSKSSLPPLLSGAALRIEPH